MFLVHSRASDEHCALGRNSCQTIYKETTSVEEIIYGGKKKTLHFDGGEKKKAVSLWEEGMGNMTVGISYCVQTWKCKASKCSQQRIS